MTVVDCAGARIGGAKRLLDEFDLYLRDRPELAVQVIGRDRALTAPWLLRREVAGHRVERALALNNVSFQRTGRERRVLIHGAQHFLRLAEAWALGRRVSPAVHAQAPVVWAAARRADLIFVPSTSMAERVIHKVPSARDRLVVAFNPVTPPPGARHRSPAGPRPWSAGTGALGGPAVDFLCPIILSPQKRMTPYLRAALAAIDLLAEPPERIEARLTVTTTAARIEDPAVAHHARLRLIGEHPTADVGEMIARCSAVYFPSELESFGYPMAEGRAMGVPVVAADSPHNREIAGPALVPYQRVHRDDLAAAMHAALRANPAPEPDGLFDRGPYFDRLLGVTPA